VIALGPSEVFITAPLVLESQHAPRLTCRGTLADTGTAVPQSGP
jgi:hypothetical protein